MIETAIRKMNLNTLMQKSHCHIYVKDCAGKYLFANDHMLNDIGFTNIQNLMGLTDEGLNFLPSIEAHKLRLNDQFIIKSDVIKSFVEPVTLHNGSKISLISHKEPLRLRSKKLIGILGVSFVFNNDEINSAMQMNQAIDQSNDADLTKRQLDVLHCLVNGMTLKEIARELRLSPRTIESHLISIKLRLGCNKRSELISKALRMPIIKQLLD